MHTSSMRFDRSNDLSSQQQAEPSQLKHRVRRGAKARREQQLRSDTRMLTRLLSGLTQISSHRGGRLSQIGLALQSSISSLDRERTFGWDTRNQMPVCRHFIHNRCSYGSQCRFSHDIRQQYYRDAQQDDHDARPQDDWYSRQQQENWDTHRDGDCDAQPHVDPNTQQGDYGEIDAQRDQLLEQQLIDSYSGNTLEQHDVDADGSDEAIPQTYDAEVVQQPEQAENLVYDEAHAETSISSGVAPDQIATSPNDVSMNHSSDLTAHHSGSEQDIAATLDHNIIDVKPEQPASRGGAGAATTCDLELAADDRNREIDVCNDSIDGRTVDAHSDIVDRVDEACAPTVAVAPQKHQSTAPCQFLDRSRRSRNMRMVARGAFGQSPVIRRRLKGKQAWAPVSESQIAKDLEAIRAFEQDKSVRLSSKSSSDSWKPGMMTPIDTVDIEASIKLLLADQSPSAITMKQLRVQIEELHQLPSGSLLTRQDEIKTLVVQYVNSKTVMKRPAGKT